MIKQSQLFNKYLYLVFFIAFSGYYAVLILVTNFLSLTVSRYFTIPLRIIILVLLYLMYKNNHLKRLSIAGRWFFVFTSFYFIRIGVETLKPSILYMSTESFFLYFSGFVVIPFFLLHKTMLNSFNYTKIVDAILLSSLSLSLLTYFFYGNLVGKVGRISQEITKEENYISPLALSYCAALAIGIGVSYLLTNKVSKWRLGYIILVMISCIVPFFLGASRGSVIAFILPFIIYFIYSSGMKNKFKTIFMSFIIVLLTLYATNYMGSNVFDRVLSIQEGVEEGSSSAIRLEIWKKGINQFLNNPFFGNSLESELVNHYPHNILIEVLISTGIFGFIPFLIFLTLTFKKCIYIIKFNPKYFWISIIFFQAFLQNMFSGAIWSAAWLAIGAGLVLGFNPKQVYKK